MRQLLIALASVLVVTSSLRAQGRGGDTTRETSTGTPFPNGLGVEGGVVFIVILEDAGALEHPVKLQFKSRLMRPDRETGTGDLMEFICNGDNQYGSAGGFRPGTGAGNK